MISIIKDKLIKISNNQDNILKYYTNILKTFI